MAGGSGSCFVVDCTISKLGTSSKATAEAHSRNSFTHSFFTHTLLHSHTPSLTRSLLNSPFDQWDEVSVEMQHVLFAACRLRRMRGDRRRWRFVTGGCGGCELQRCCGEGVRLPLSPRAILGLHSRSVWGWVKAETVETNACTGLDLTPLLKGTQTSRFALALKGKPQWGNMT